MGEKPRFRPADADFTDQECVGLVLGFRVQGSQGGGGGMWFEEPWGHIEMYWDISGCVGFGVPNFLYAGVYSALGSKMVGSCPSGLAFWGLRVVGAQGSRIKP